MTVKDSTVQIEDYNKQLKYCPFCGSPATLVGTYTCQYKEVTYSVKCTGETPHELKIYSTMPEVAVRAWNKRVFRHIIQEYDTVVEDIVEDKIFIKEPKFPNAFPVSPFEFKKDERGKIVKGSTVKVSVYREFRDGGDVTRVEEFSLVKE